MDERGNKMEAVFGELPTRNRHYQAYPSRQRIAPQGPRMDLRLLRSYCLYLYKKDPRTKFSFRKVQGKKASPAQPSFHLFSGVKNGCFLSLPEDVHLLFVFGPWLFLLDQLVDQPRDGPAANAPWRLRFSTVGISHVP